MKHQHSSGFAGEYFAVIYQSLLQSSAKTINDLRALIHVLTLSLVKFPLETLFIFLDHTFIGATSRRFFSALIHLCRDFVISNLIISNKFQATPVLLLEQEQVYTIQTRIQVKITARNFPTRRNIQDTQALEPAAELFHSTNRSPRRRLSERPTTSRTHTNSTLINYPRSMLSMAKSFTLNFRIPFVRFPSKC